MNNNDDNNNNKHTTTTTNNNNNNNDNNDTTNTNNNNTNKLFWKAMQNALKVGITKAHVDVALAVANWGKAATY